MSLVVDLFDPRPDADALYLNAIDHDAAGFESYRTALWSAPPLVSRGAVFLPRLRDGDLFAYPEDLDAFDAECARLSLAADAIAAELGWADGATPIRAYLDRFRSAVALARERGAGVYIG